MGPPRLRSRSCDCGQIRRDEVLGLKGAMAFAVPHRVGY